MTTQHISLTGKPYETIRIDKVDNRTLITVYNIDMKDIDLLIEKLQALKIEHEPKPDVKPFEAAVKASQEAKIQRDYDDTHVKPMHLGAVTPASIIIDDVMVVEVVKAEPVEAIQQHKRIVLPTPEMPQMQRGPGVINVRGVMTKAYKNSPASRKTDENADILKNVFIRIYGISDEKIKSYDRDTHTTTLHRVAFDRTFKIGDTVEYDSYNFAYLGTIDSIGEKTVTIAVKGQTRKVQLDLHTFIRRNWDLNLEKIAEERANWYD